MIFLVLPTNFVHIAGNKISFFSPIIRILSFIIAVIFRLLFWTILILIRIRISCGSFYGINFALQFCFVQKRIEKSQFRFFNFLRRCRAQLISLGKLTVEGINSYNNFIYTIFQKLAKCLEICEVFSSHHYIWGICLQILAIYFFYYCT